MKKIEILGSVSVDMVLYVEALPKREGDNNVLKQEMRLGGCAFHVANALQTGELWVPIGRGFYADFVWKNRDQIRSKVHWFESKEENGVCYCLVEPDGERSFMAYHGADYRYDPAMLETLPSCDLLYFDGITMEEKQNECIIDHLDDHSEIMPFFACSSRIENVASLSRILDLRPILHMNRNEFYMLGDSLGLYRRAGRFEDHLETLWKRTRNLIFVTDGKNGSYAYDGILHFAPSVPVKVNDTIGAGDTHAGSCLYGLQRNWDLDTILAYANRKGAEKISGQL